MAGAAGWSGLLLRSYHNLKAITIKEKTTSNQIHKITVKSENFRYMSANVFEKRNSPFDTLNRDTCNYISTFLRNPTEVNNFLQASKQLWLEANVAGFRYISLNKRHSSKYLTNEVFRKKVLSLLKYPNQQLNLTLSDCSNVYDVSALGDVHTLNLSCCDNVHDVSALGGVHTLNLSRCDNVYDVSS